MLLGRDTRVLGKCINFVNAIEGLDQSYCLGAVSGDVPRAKALRSVGPQRVV
jgi:hypothetical protein